MSSDKIIIQGIEFYGYHGDLSQERELGQRFSVDLELMCDMAQAGSSDNLKDTIDYAAVVKRVLEIGCSEQYRMIEALAERMAGTILSEFSPTEVRVRVTKPHPPIPASVRSVGVEVLRKR